jgi:hypothetical protein
MSMSASLGKLLTILLFLPLLTSCPSSGPAPITTYARIVIDTYEPRGGLPGNVPADTYLTLYDASGNQLASDDQGNTDSGQNGSSRIDYILGLTLGTYYLKVTKGSTNATGPYAVRFLWVDVGSALPVPPYDPLYLPIDPDPYEFMDAPETTPPLSIAPVSVNLGVDNFGRILDPTNDVDWLKLVLP